MSNLEENIGKTVVSVDHKGNCIAYGVIIGVENTSAFDSRFLRDFRYLVRESDGVKIRWNPREARIFDKPLDFAIGSDLRG